MDNNCGVGGMYECGYIVGVVSRRRVWLVEEGGIYGFGCKELYRFPQSYYLSLLLLYMFFFAAAYFFVH